MSAKNDCEATGVSHRILILDRRDWTPSGVHDQPPTTDWHIVRGGPTYNDLHQTRAIAAYFNQQAIDKEVDEWAVIVHHSNT